MATSPPVVSVRHGPVLVVRFRDRPNRESLAALRALTVELTQSPDPLSFVGVVPGKLTLPGAKFRAELTELRSELRPFTASIHLAITGDGFFARLQRNMFTGLSAMLAAQVRFVVHETAEQALTAVAEERKLDATALREAARNAGVLV